MSLVIAPQACDLSCKPGLLPCGTSQSTLRRLGVCLSPQRGESCEPGVRLCEPRVKTPNTCSTPVDRATNDFTRLACDRFASIHAHDKSRFATTSWCIFAQPTHLCVAHVKSCSSPTSAPKHRRQNRIRILVRRHRNHAFHLALRFRWRLTQRDKRSHRFLRRDTQRRCRRDF